MDEKTNEWQMDQIISNVASWSIGIGDSYHGITISRLPSELKLFEFMREPNIIDSICGLTTVTNGYNVNLINLPQSGIINVDSIFSLTYADQTSCGPERVIEGYFLKGELTVVSGHHDYLSSYAKKIPDLRTRGLVNIFGGALKSRLEKIQTPLKTIRSLIKNSNLPKHYKEAVKGIL